MGVLKRLFGGANREAEQQLLEEFVQKAARGESASCRIKIGEYLDILEKLRGALREQRDLSSSAAIDLVNEKLSARCPECGGRTSGQQLAWLEVTQAFGGVVGSGAGRAAAFLQGVCPNPACGSRKWVLEWAG